MAAEVPVITGAAEGLVDEAVLRRLLEHVGAATGPIYGKNGKAHLRRHLRGYNQAARYSPWLVLVDLDDDAHCAPPFLQEWLPDPAPNMCFRVAVREIEAWLLADRERMAAFLQVGAGRIPPEPEALNEPKRALVQLAGQSRRRDIREDMVPRPGTGREVGPAYTSRLIEFVWEHRRGWRPEVAALASDSLRRCLVSLRKLAGR